MRANTETKKYFRRSGLRHGCINRRFDAARSPRVDRIPISVSRPILANSQLTIFAELCRIAANGRGR